MKESVAEYALEFCLDIWHSVEIGIFVKKNL